MNFFSSILVFCLVLYYDSSFAQEWRMYDETNSDLENSYVKDIVIDTNGIAWIGTTEDLYSFDGLNWEHFEVNMTNSNPNITYIEDMHLLIDNNILIGTSDGICVFNTQSKTVDYSLNLNIPFSFIRAVGQSSDGTIWAGKGVAGGIIASFSNGTWTPFQTFSSSSEVYAISNNGNAIWFSSGSLKKYENGIFTAYDYTNSPLVQSALISALAFDKDGNLWLDAPNNAVPSIYRLMKFDGNNWYEYDTINCILNGSHISDIYPLDSIIWFSLEYQGIVAYNYHTNECEFYNETNSPLSSFHFGGLTMDKEKNIYIGTDAGLIIYNDDKIVMDSYKYADVFIYPNPFNEIINFRFFAETDQNVPILIYNDIGELIYSNSFFVNAGKIDYSLEIKNLNRGIYFLKSQINNQTISEKLIKIN